MERTKKKPVVQLKQPELSVAHNFSGLFVFRRISRESHVPPPLRPNTSQQLRHVERDVADSVFFNSVDVSHNRFFFFNLVNSRFPLGGDLWRARTSTAVHLLFKRRPMFTYAASRHRIAFKTLHPRRNTFSTFF